MFRQSIDPKGGFPPTAGKKTKSSKKKKPIKRRKKTRDPLSRERQQQRAFQFGEVRSGLSGRSVYNPDQFIRFHQSSQFNQERDKAEKTRSGGTFTGTSIGEEKRVKEAQEVDRRFKERELEVKKDFVGAINKLAERTKTPDSRKPELESEVLKELRGIRREVIEAKKPKTVPTISRASSESSVGVADIEEITSPIPESSGGISDRRKPEDSLEINPEEDRRKIQARRKGFLSQGSSGGGSALLTSAPRPDIKNPSSEPLIRLDSVGEVVKGKSIFSQPSPLLTSQTKSKVFPDLNLSGVEEEDIPDLESIDDASFTPKETPSKKTTEEVLSSPTLREAVGGLKKTISSKPKPQSQSPEPQVEEPLLEFVGSTSYDKLKEDSGSFTTGSDKDGYTPTKYSFVDVKGQIGKKVKGQKYFVMGIKGKNYQIVADSQPNLSGWNSVAKSKLDKLVKSQDIDFIE